MKNLVGVFETPARAEAVVHELVRRGVPREEISLLHSDAGRVITEAPGGVLGDGEATGQGNQRTADGTTMSQNIAGGALFGGIGGLLIGLSALAIPGIGPVIAAGPLAATLAGAGFGALGGGLIGAIKDLGVPDEDAAHYAERIERGDTLVSVRVPDDQVADVKRLMDGLDAAGIEERPEVLTATVPTADFVSARAHYEARQRGTAAGPTTQDELTAGTPVVDRRGSVQSPVAGQSRERPVDLAEGAPVSERLVVDVPLQAFEEGTIEFRERGEEPVIRRNVRLVEQVVVGTESTQHTETVRDTVRHTDVSVERIG